MDLVIIPATRTLAVNPQSPNFPHALVEVAEYGIMMTGTNIDKILELAPSPAYVVDLGRLRHNLAILDEVQKRSGARILIRR